MLTTELISRSDKKEDLEAERGTISNRILHRQKSELGEAASEAAGLNFVRKGLRTIENNQTEDERNNSKMESRRKRRAMRKVKHNHTEKLHKTRFDTAEIVMPGTTDTTGKKLHSKTM